MKETEVRIIYTVKEIYEFTLLVEFKVCYKHITDKVSHSCFKQRGVEKQELRAQITDLPITHY